MKKIRTAARDFTPDMLPRSRRQQFSDCIRVHTDTLLCVGFFMLLFLLPLSVFRLVADVSFAQMTDAEAGVVSAFRQVTALVEIPLWLIFAVGAAGLSRILRQLILGEPVFFGRDLALGIRQNAGTYLLTFGLFGAFRFLNVMAEEVLPSVIGFIPSLIFWILLVPIGFYVLSQTIFYTNPFGKSITNGFSLYLRTAPYVWLFLLTAALPMVARLVPFLWLRIFLDIVFGLIWSPLVLFAWLLYSVSVFDRFVNPAAFPQMVGKGLWSPSEQPSAAVRRHVLSSVFTPCENPPEMTVSHLTVRYGKGKDAVTALCDVDLSFSAGGFHVVAGYSGCGKTTLLRALSGMTEYEGEIFFNGQNAKELDTKDREMAYVSQQYILYPKMTVFDNIAYPLRTAHMSKEEICARVCAMAETLDLTPCLDRKPRHLSGGQQQRVALARALVRSPAVCLMDEPLSNTDAQTRTNLRHLLRDAQRRLGCTVVYVTHDMMEAMALADRLTILCDGKVVISDTPEAVYKSGNEVVRSLFAE